MRRISVRGTSTFSAATLGVVVLSLGTTALGAPQRPEVVNLPIPAAVTAHAEANKAAAARHRAALERAEALQAKRAKAAKIKAKRKAARVRAAKAAARAAAAQRAAAVAASRAAARPGTNRALGRELARARGWGDGQFMCLDRLWTAESGWSTTARNSSGAYGIPQAYPGSKMASAGSDWASSARTQIRWGLSYIAGRYGTPCAAYGAFQSKGWY